jgi:acyl-CoA reductase-like NAD-dependent aldehyde dehydrogenase
VSEQAPSNHDQQPLSREGAREKAAVSGQESPSFARQTVASGEGSGFAAPLTVPLLIAGEERHTPENFQVFDPARPDEVVGLAASASVQDALDAVAAADRAFGDWSRIAPERRAQMLVDAVGALTDGLDERIDLLVRENGKVRMEASIEMAVFANRCLLAAELAPKLSEVIHLAQESRVEPVIAGGIERARPSIPYVSEISRMPVGVVTIIVPFNWPLAILAASLPYALVAGCTVIVKPPPTTPIAMTLTLIKLASKLPPGVLNIVTGSNDAVKPIIVDPRVRKLVFTGSTGGPGHAGTGRQRSGNFARRRRSQRAGDRPACRRRFPNHWTGMHGGEADIRASLALR